MKNINKNGAFIAVYGVLFSLAMATFMHKLVPNFNNAICNVASPIANFEDELQFAKSVRANDECKDKANFAQFSTLAFFILIGYNQFLRTLILASYLTDTKVVKKDEEFYLIEDAKSMYSGLLENSMLGKVGKGNPYKFETLDQLKIAHQESLTRIDAHIQNRIN